MYESFFRQKEIIFQNPIPDNIFIYVDQDLFSCVIRNLVSNAIKYTPNGGSIIIGHELDEESVTVVISDSGKGMAISDLESVFSPDNIAISMPGLMQEKGSGLGLKLCKDFVEMNDGKIWAKSIKGIGTQIFFTVPLGRPAVQVNEKEEPEFADYKS